MLSTQESILIFGAIILTCGSGGLLIVRWTNPLLKGMGWMAAAFAAGGAGALLLLTSRSIPPVAGVVLADVLVLAAFFFLDVAVVQLMDGAPKIPVFGLVLLAVQAGCDFVLLAGHGPGHFRVIMTGFLIAAQAGRTALRLYRHEQPAMRPSARFTAIILTLLGAENFVRSMAYQLRLMSPQVSSVVQVVTFALFLAVALGIAFGFFWMTTSLLTTGLERIASTDPLTRLFNRRVFLLWCEKEIARSKKTGAPFSILMIDMDHFKQINDNFGHSMGDVALCTAVERMQHSVRGVDVLGRWGGEEFAALLPNANMDSAFVVAERVRANVEKMLLPAQGMDLEKKLAAIRLTVSVGIATYQGYGDSLQSMLLRADTSLYQAKAAGRNRVLAAGQLSLVSA